ncbi:hypothetical protein OPFLODJI_01784 [Aeromonas hydrophila]
MIRCHSDCIMGEHKMRIADVARESVRKVDLETREILCLFF